MKKTILFIAMSALLIGAAVWVEHAWFGHTPAAHEHAEAEHTQMALNAGKRWATDEALRTGMQRIRDAAAEQQGAALATTTKEQVDYLITNCKLDSQADAALHGIISQLLTGADMLSKKPESLEGMEKIRHALHQYPDYFDHPDFEVTQ